MKLKFDLTSVCIEQEKGLLTARKASLLFSLVNTSNLSQVCGKVDVRNWNNAKIVNGLPTEPHQFPWHVGVRSLSLKTVYCGGVLLSKEWILSAAHCFNTLSADDIDILLGKQDLTKHEPGERKRSVSEIIRHPKFNPFAMHNDFALLKLKKSVIFSETIAPICLPCDRFETHEGAEVWVAGWGSSGPNTNTMAHILQKTNLTVLSDGQCRDHFGRIPRGALCAIGKHGQDACAGDSGGPLMYYNMDREQFEVIGVVSWGIGCGHFGVPGVYGRVTSAFNFFHNSLWTWNNETKCARA
eukprot:TCALIF_04783-PA protein Name:"Similar to Trypsin II-P29 (Gallus gallus)" AED:0.11 eAED:0.11 QI:10/1/0.5/1/0.66/0.75/4/0/297